MVGVSSRMLARQRARGVTFLLGYVAGTALVTVLLVVAIQPVGHVIQDAVPGRARLSLLASALLLLAAADALGHTPTVRRQTPQVLLRSLNPAPLGLVYGGDVGLIATTIKVSSLVWMALAYTVLQDYRAASYVLATYGGVTVLTVAITAAVGVGGQRRLRIALMGGIRAGGRIAQGVSAAVGAGAAVWVVTQLWT